MAVSQGYFDNEIQPIAMAAQKFSWNPEGIKTIHWNQAHIDLSSRGLMLLVQVGNRR